MDSSTDVLKIQTFINNNQSHILDELKSFLAFKSVSTDPRYQNDILVCAEFVSKKLKSIGMKAVEIFSEKGHPIVFGEWIQNESYKTILFYGHYDVQPPEPLEEWLTPPFEPNIRGGFIYARGASDDKGQVWCHISAIEYVIQNSDLFKVNIKILIEGEEEIGSQYLHTFLESNREKLNADVIFVSDTPMLGPGLPSICQSLRGIVYAELRVKTGHFDLHSGQAGGVGPNAITVLTNVLSQLKHLDGTITIPEFYDGVLVQHVDDKLPNRTEKDWQSVFGSFFALASSGEEGYQKLWNKPTLDCNGILGGYTGTGSKTVIAVKAMAKISMRLVGKQSSKKIADSLTAYVKTLVPSGCQIECDIFEASDPLWVDATEIGLVAAKKAVKSVFKTTPYVVGEGGSIPILSHMQSALKATPVLLGYNFPDDHIHAPNERFGLDNLWNGIATTICFISEFQSL